jgi:hypothetical protein
MRFLNFSTTLIACTVGCSTLGGLPANAQNSVQNASTASGHASKAVTLGITASGQATLGVIAVPILSAGFVSGGVGGASTAAGKSSAAAGGLSTSGPLPITDEAITITPPTEALKQRASVIPR